jgi:phenylpropionate dioxygenase-like ring-hydroxylating dioxygenase large terminal subunit
LEYVPAVARFPKPAEGSWTQHYPELGTAPVSYRDSTSPEFYELEREAIFERAWLNVGRVEQLPRNGSYFTKELAVAKTSIIVVRGLDGEVRAFHNICRHRGNKLVWQDYPREETAGSCRQFVCKYHGWQYDLDGGCTFVQQESEFFDLDKADYGLVPVHCDVWEGFIFVNLDREPSQRLRDFLGPMVTALDGYPFGQVTERFCFTADIPANWKVFVDTLQEQYHAPIVHQNQRPETFDAPMQVYGFEAPHYQLDGPHRMFTSPGILPWNLPDDQVKPMERLIRSGLFGPWDAPELGALPAGMNPGGCDPWGVSLFLVFPNFGIQFWERGWYHTYHHWPTSPSSHHFELNLYFTPSVTARERLAREMAAVTFREFALQDDNLIVAQQEMLESRVVERFPLGDQEILCRHFHAVVGQWVDDWQRAHVAV